MLYHELLGVLGLPIVGENKQLGFFRLNSQEIVKGDVFLACNGENVDGHDFIDEAIGKGASLVIGSKDYHKENYIVVADVRQAIIKLARFWRESFKGKVIAITGTVGKTTTKELLAAILKTVARVSYTIGNYNNEWGVPITLLNSSLESEYLLVEVGARYPLDITAIVSWLKPHIGIITKVGLGHTKNMGDEFGVAKCKYEMVTSLPQDSLAFMRNIDKERFVWDARDDILIGKHAVMYDVNIRWDQASAIFAFEFMNCQNKMIKENWRIVLPNASESSLENSLLVAAVTRYFDVPIANIISVLSEGVFVPGRNMRYLVKDCWIIDDTYNANPTSMLSAIESLQLAEGACGVFLGDMLDLDDERVHHSKLIAEIDKKNISVLCTYGPLMQEAASLFSKIVYHDPDSEMLKEIIIKHNLRFLLIKGSRSMKMERFVQNLLDWSV